MKPTRRALSHLLLCSLAPISLLLAQRCSIHSHAPLCSAALLCAPLRSFVFSLAHSLTAELMGKIFMSMNSMRRFHTVSTHCAPSSHPMVLLPALRHYLLLSFIARDSFPQQRGFSSARVGSLDVFISSGQENTHSTLYCSQA